MSQIALTAPLRTTDEPATLPTLPTLPTSNGPAVDNRSSYVAWGLTWLVGQGAFALSAGSDPLVPMPALLPAALLGAGVVASMVVTARATVRAQRGVTGPAKLTGTLVGGGWGVAFTSLFLLTTALAGVLGDQHVQTLLWPAGTGLVVGLMYLLGGTVQRDLHQYALGAWLALTATAGLFLGLPGLYWVVAVAGGGAYLVAAALEPRRLALASTVQAVRRS